jgi:hypothetical protein
MTAAAGNKDRPFPIARDTMYQNQWRRCWWSTASSPPSPWRPGVTGQETDQMEAAGLLRKAKRLL